VLQSRLFAGCYPSMKPNLRAGRSFSEVGLLHSERARLVDSLQWQVPVSPNAKECVRTTSPLLLSSLQNIGCPSRRLADATSNMLSSAAWNKNPHLSNTRQQQSCTGPTIGSEEVRKCIATSRLRLSSPSFAARHFSCSITVMAAMTLR